MKKRSSNSVSRAVLSSRHTNLLERARAFPVEAVRPWGDKAKFTAEYCDVRPLPCDVRVNCRQLRLQVLCSQAGHQLSCRQMFLLAGSWLPAVLTQASTVGAQLAKKPK